MNVLVQCEGILTKGGKRIPQNVVTISTLSSYANVIVVCDDKRRIEADLEDTERQTKPWYSGCPLNSDCSFTEESLEKLLLELNPEDVLITNLRAEASLLNMFGCTVFWINPSMKGHITHTKIYAVPELRQVPSLIQRLKGARTYLEKQYGVNPLDYI